MTYLPSHPEPMIYRAFARAFPSPLDALGPFTECLLYGDGPLTLGERELIAAYVGALSGCDYVHRSHRHAALAHGMDAGIVDSVLDTSSGDPGGDPRLAAALNLVRLLNETPSACDAARIAATIAAGHDEAAIRQIVYLAGYWAMIVRMVDGLGMSGDDAYHAQMGRQLAREAHAIHARLGAERDV